MNKLILIICCLLCAFNISNAQPYGNEWIDFEKPYYKLTLNATKVYRISYTTLAEQFDESELIGNNFKLFGKGNEIPIYVSTDGQFSTNDYIEFYGKHNDGEIDVPLYRYNQNLHTYYSLYTNVAAYFLSLDDTGNNRRLVDQANDPTGLTPEPYFWHNAVSFYIDTDPSSFNSGQQLSNFGDYKVLRDSYYGKGEGWTGTPFNGPATRNRTVSTPAVYRGDNSLEAKLNHVHVTKSWDSQHESIISVGSSSFSYTFTSFGVRKINEEFPVSDVSNGTTTVSYRENNTALVTDAMVSIEYPREFDFSNETTFAFTVDNISPTLLQITNFDRQSTTPVLYDLNNDERYEAIISGNRLDFGLNAVTQERNLLLVSQATTNIGDITSLDSVGFIDYSLPPNQGNYIILSHKKLKTSTDNIDYVTAYHEYRLSPEGGLYESQLAFIQDIENQFGFGVRNHPMAIRKFVNYMVDNFTIQPEHLFIIGKGISYNEIRHNSNNFNNCLIPSMGVPDSDSYLTARAPENEIPQIAIGRLSANTGEKVAQYLEKVMEFEAAQNDTSAFVQTVEGKQWMKRVLHLGGGKNAGEQADFKRILNNFKAIIEAPQYGGTVTSVFKSSTEPIEISTSQVVDSLIQNGVSLITFFGHSSTSTIDFDITPEEFNNYGKYNVFLSNGCFVGSIFGPSLNTYSDRFIFQDGIGSVAYIAPITLAVPSSLERYSSSFYKKLSNTMYHQSIGTAKRSVSEELITEFSIFETLLAKQMILHGDPGLKLNSHSAPDYIISKESINYDPSIVSASSDSFDVKIAITNIGRAIDANYNVHIRRIFSNGTFADYQKRIPAAVFRDTVILTLPTDRVDGLGTNILSIKVDHGEEIAELSEDNNVVIDTLIVFADDIRPILPYDYCISNVQPDNIYFSTASIGGGEKNYILQIDTTLYFNSPLFNESQVLSNGGIIEWTPSIPYIENTVYYVRSALDSLIGGEYNWNYSSFLYNTSLSTGWNQSHFFQFKNNNFFTLQLEEPDRLFDFSDEQREVRLINAVFNSSFSNTDNQTFLDGNLLNRGALSEASMNFFVFDPATGKYLESYTVESHPNNPNAGCILGTFLDIHSCDFPSPRPVINFQVGYRVWRRRIMNFINNSIPDGAYVLAFTTQRAPYSLNVDQWEADTISPTLDRSLNKVFEEELGSTEIRNLQNYRPYLLWTQKGNQNFPKVEFHADLNTIVDTTLYFSGNWNVGAMRSVKIGPSTQWNSLEFEHYSLDDPDHDSISFSISGIDSTGRINQLFEGITNTGFPLSAINADQYPNLQLEMYARDDSNRTAPQLKNWRVLYDKVPEAAVDPSLSYSISRDTIDIGQSVSLEAGITNISDLDMDSLLVRVILNRQGGAPINIFKRFGELKAGESQILNFDLSSDIIVSTGDYTILLEANPMNDQPEQFHFNNYATFLLHVNEDRINPLMDVTFDGVHILDGDIVSTRPEIEVKLKDENKGLALTDTASIEMYIYYPDAPNTPIYIDPNSEEINFVPADENELGEKNEAFMYYNPNFEVDGIYRLKVQGKDARNNDAGDYDYIVSFEVINETSISNFLNYPNPFSNSTRFVFILTGAEIPDQIKIQIMTISGKVVREITASELGPLRIGRNITEYAWNGTDRFGDKLANGLYIYKVFTKLNGEVIDQYKTNADRFFENDGFGKMYIVR